MILYLLLPVLILGVVDSANMTAEVSGNQTFSESTDDNSTMKPGNVTSSLDKDRNELQILDKLQSNDTLIVITGDDENFQDQEAEFPGRHCRQDLLVAISHSHCGAVFHKDMTSISPENWCVLEKIIRSYNDMTICLERLSQMVGCYYPNYNIQDFFLSIHSFYFQNCSEAELQLVDAPQWVVIALTLAPVSLIPVLVYLVVWKSNVHK